MKLTSALFLFFSVKFVTSYKNPRLENKFSPPNHLVNEQRRSAVRHLNAQSSVSSKHFVSPQYSYVPKYSNNRQIVEYGKALGHRNRNLQTSQNQFHLAFPKKALNEKFRQTKNHRETRKIQKSLKIDKSFLKNKLKPKRALKKDLIKHLEKDDNLAVESQVVQTVFKPPSAVNQPKTTYNAKPAPKFIIKQAGPSQTYGWLGHGKYAPLNIPNIFKNLKLDTSWNPSINSIFPVSLNYPAAKPFKVNPGNTVIHNHPETLTTKRPTDEAPKIKESPIPVYKPTNTFYKEPSKKKPVKDQHQTGELATLWYDTEKVKPYTQSPTSKPARKPQLYIPHFSTTAKTTTTTTSITTTTKQVVYNPTTTIKSFVYTSPVYNSETTTKVSYRQPSTLAPSYSSPSYFQSTPSTYFSSPIYKPKGISSPTPLFGSPSPYISTSAPYTNTPSYSISTSSPSVYNSYKPFDFSQPLKPFTAFTSG